LRTCTIVPVDADKAREARNLLLKPKIVEMTFDDLGRKVFRENRARGWTDPGVAAPE
jgi:U3 small nucleolar ribonucleoprotein component